MPSPDNYSTMLPMHVTLTQGKGGAPGPVKAKNILPLVSQATHTGMVMPVAHTIHV